METAIKERAVKDRYVELTYLLPGEQQCRFYAIVLQAKTPTDALEQAIEDCQRKHPDASNIEEFMQRIISERKARKIRDKMIAGTWSGWDFGQEVD